VVIGQTKSMAATAAAGAVGSTIPSTEGEHPTQTGAPQTNTAEPRAGILRPVGRTMRDSVNQVLRAIDLRVEQVTAPVHLRTTEVGIVAAEAIVQVQAPATEAEIAAVVEAVGTVSATALPLRARQAIRALLADLLPAEAARGKVVREGQRARGAPAAAGRIAVAVAAGDGGRRCATD
jgi:hypothetical protein